MRKSVLLAVFLCVVCVGRIEARQSLARLPGYIELHGPDAKRFIVGNSLLRVGGDREGPEYYPDAFHRYDGASRGSIDCSVRGAVVTDDTIGTAADPHSYRVFRSRSAPLVTPRGRVMGLLYYVGPFPGQSDSYAKVIKGNVSDCPDAHPSGTRIAVTASRERWDATAASDQRPTKARSRLMADLLIGNTIFRPDARKRRDGDDLLPEDAYYFDRGGRFYGYRSGEVISDRYRIEHGALCVRREDPLGFSFVCDEFKGAQAKDQPDPNRLHVEVVDTLGDDREPYRLLRGNPMGFSLRR